MVLVGGWMGGGRPVVVVVAGCTIVFVRIRRRLNVGECSVIVGGATC